MSSALLAHPGEVDKRFDPLAGWGWGATLATALGVWCSWAEPSLPLVLVSSGAVFLWGIWAWRQPAHAFMALMLTWITLYSRATFPYFQVEGGSSRGGVRVFDFIWLAHVLAWIARYGTRHRLRLFPRRIDTLLVVLIPFMVLSIVPALLAVWLLGHPLSYVIANLRYLQWVSFAPMGYWFCKQFGLATTMRALLTVFAVAGVLHGVYATVQLLAFLEVLSADWVGMDHAFRRRFPVIASFFYPRTTGLLINPNDYSFFGAFALILLCALMLSGARVNNGMALALGIAGLWAVVTGASRSATLGTVASVLVMTGAFLLRAIAQRDYEAIARLARFSAWTVILMLAAITLLLSVLPESLVNRVQKIAAVAREGPQADPNAAARVYQWSEFLRVYEDSYPLGTWSPPHYLLSDTLGLHTDSYYIHILVQGTPLYLGAFIAFVLGMMWRGGHAMQSDLPWERFVGFATIGICTLVGVTSITDTPLQQPQIIVPFWLLLGVYIAERRL